MRTCAVRRQRSHFRLSCNVAALLKPRCQTCIGLARTAALDQPRAQPTAAAEAGRRAPCARMAGGQSAPASRRGPGPWTCPETPMCLPWTCRRRGDCPVATPPALSRPRTCAWPAELGRAIFSAGSRPMDTSRKALSRKGTRGSRPHANGALFARSTSNWCSRSSSATVSLPPPRCTLAPWRDPPGNPGRLDAGLLAPDVAARARCQRRARHCRPSLQPLQRPYTSLASGRPPPGQTGGRARIRPPCAGAGGRQAAGGWGRALVQRARRGRLVEEEVAAVDLVGALAAQHHLEAARLDLARQQVHRHRRPHLPRAAARHALRIGRRAPDSALLGISRTQRAHAAWSPGAASVLARSVHVLTAGKNPCPNPPLRQR